MPSTTPTEYSIRYRFINNDNQKTTGGATGQKTSVNRTEFTVSGDTSITIGKVTRIVYKHYHTSTGTCTWNLYGKLVLPNRTISSDTVSVRISKSINLFTNTFLENLPTPEEMANWTSIQTWSAGNDRSSAELYWRAYADGNPDGGPLDMYVYFYDAGDLVDGADPPTISGVSFTDAESHDGLQLFGNYVQGLSLPVATASYQLDPEYPYLSATHTFQLFDSSGVLIQQIAQEDNGIFNLNAISGYGTYSWTYTILDTAGNSVSTNGTFNVLPYTTPSITGLSIERYEVQIDDEGHYIYVASDDGVLVRFSLRYQIQSIANNNAWSLVLKYTPDSGNASTINVDSGTDGTIITRTDDRTILGQTIIDSGTPWDFEFILTDTYSTVSASGSVSEAGAYFNVEATGVSVGMRSTSDENNKKFEVAEGYKSEFNDDVNVSGATALVGGVNNFGGSIQCGVTSTITVSASNYKDTEILFGKPFAYIPIVMACFYTNSTNGTFGRCSCAVVSGSVTTTGFVIRVFNGDSAVREPRVNWIAIGLSTSDPGSGGVELIERPAAAMTSNSSQNCVVTRSSVYSSSYEGYRAFNNDLSSSWACATSDTTPWIAIQMDIALKNISVSIYSRSDSSNIENPLGGQIMGSNDGATWVEIGTFSGWSSTDHGVLLGTITCNNETAYQYVRINITERRSGGPYVAIGNISIRGIYE